MIKGLEDVPSELRCNTIWDLLQTFLGELVNWLEASDVVNTSNTRSCLYNTVSKAVHANCGDMLPVTVVPLRYITLSQLPEHWCTCEYGTWREKHVRGMNDRVVCMYVHRS